MFFEPVFKLGRGMHLITYVEFIGNCFGEVYIFTFPAAPQVFHVKGVVMIELVIFSYEILKYVAHAHD